MEVLSSLLTFYISLVKDHTENVSHLRSVLGLILVLEIATSGARCVRTWS